MPVRLLLVEDSADDELLLLHLLKTHDVEVEHVRVEEAEALRQALTKPWDVVISDYHLPKLDALRALDIVRDADDDLPFIVVSGNVGEDLAVEAMRRGAQDYVMKSNLKRLPEIVRRELKEFAHRKEKKSLEEQVRQSQKMEAMGQLASSVAHDFNNLLTVIISFTQMAHDDLPPDHHVRPDLREVVDCAKRAAVMTRQLLSFSRKSVLDPRLLDLNEVMSSSEKMLRRLLGPRIDYQTRPSSEPCYVIADRGLIEQVVVNLIVNARDAMPSGGTLTVETGLAEARAFLAITDTGSGMSEEVRARIFEPFFTTKGVGHGTGLGLSTVKSIVEQSHGEVSVYSAVGRGTTFKVYLPAADPQVVAAAAAVAPVARGGTETILVVEDEEPVRLAVQRTLAAKGYRVLEASRPHDALSLLHQPIHLVLTDVVLPEMTGKDLVQLVHESRPEASVLYMSGFAAGAMVHQGVVVPGTGFLQKPFSPEMLAEKVRTALDARRK